MIIASKKMAGPQLRTAASDSELKDKIWKAFDESWDLINTQSGWSPAKTTTLACDSVDKVEWRRRRTGGSHRKSSGRVFRVTATLPGPPERVAALIRDVNSVAKWNRTLQVFYTGLIKRKKLRWLGLGPLI
jgi:hypothetical protein